ncbi:MAG TPA: ABC transporter substrate-binding protein [Limnochordales bacterium]|nr:MAG: hypothetical protein DIU82_09555 [Bacillota bacterium]HLT59021.1 ABC transporter substrate-binding protein [Limnochordales bacterium]
MQVRRPFQRGWVAAALICAGLLALAGHGLAQAPQVFVVALETDVVQFDPVKIQDATTSQVAFQIYEHLLKRDYDGNLEPALATRWESDPTGQVWTFHLRQGVRFHDGSPFNAEVVKWHFERAMGPDSYFQTQYSVIDRIETPDDYTVVFHLKEPNAAFIDNIILANAGFIPSKKAFEEKGDAFPYEPVGTGPFKWNTWVKGQRVELARNDDWWGDGPKLDRLVIRVIPEANTQVIELETGGVHLITRASQTDLERLQQNPDVVVITKPAYRTRALEFNVAQPPFDDVRVRQAIQYAVDMPLIVRALAEPLLVPADSVVPVASWAYAGEGVLPNYPYDLQKAEKLMREAGFVRDAQGRWTKDGQPLRMTIHTPDNRYYMDVDISAAVANQLTRFGIETNVRVMEWAAYLEEVRNGQHQIAFLGWNQSSPEPSLFTDAKAKTNGRGNYGNYSDPALDAILDEALRVADEAQRRALYAEAQRIVNENAWFIWVGNEALTWIFRKEVQGFNPSPSMQYNYTEISIAR